MNKLSREEYKEAAGCLKRYNYNCVSILTMRLDLMSISSPSINGLPRAPYNVTDSVYNTVVKLQEDKKINKALNEWKAVKKALELTDKVTKDIFKKEYEERRRK